MDAIALIYSKFSDELIAAQMALFFFASAIAIYLLVLRKKKKQSAEWVPAALVKAYLDKVDADEREIRFKLFGEHAPATTFAPTAPLAAALSPQTVMAGPMTVVADPNMAREIEALRAQLLLSDQRFLDFDRQMNALKAEKAALEARLKAAPAAGAAAAPGAAPEAVVKELEDLKAKLQEYEVIEDDLANLKKFQKENEALRAKVEAMEKGGATSTVVSGGPQAPEMKTVVSGGAAPQPAPTMTLINGGGAATAAPAAADLAPKAEVADTNTNVLAPINPTFDSGAPAPAAAAPAPAPAAPAAPAPAAEAAPTAEKSAKSKEEDLLSEFEKMLAS